MRRVILCALVVLGAATGRADFILSGSEHLKVDSSHDAGTLYDSSTADVIPGGYISNTYVKNASSLAIFAGGVGNLKSYNTSKVNVAGGGISGLNAFDASNVIISGGGVHSLKSQDASNVIISGGVVNLLNASGTSSMAVSGGHFEMLYVYDTSSVTFRGYDFRVTGGLRLEGERVLGTGVLSGKWFNATPWIVNISRNDASAMVRVVPEPSTLALLAMGAVGLVAYVWRRRAGHLMAMA